MLLEKTNLKKKIKNKKIIIFSGFLIKAINEKKYK
jgi:hypothetical protein